MLFDEFDDREIVVSVLVLVVVLVVYIYKVLLGKMVVLGMVVCVLFGF